MKVVHLISGGDIGGAKTHVLTLLMHLNKEKGLDARLLCVLEEEFARDAKEMGILVTVIPQKTRYDFSAIRRIIRHIRHEGYDVIHCHGARANFIAFFLRMFLKAPIVTTVHSDYRLDFQGSWYKQLVYTPINALALHRIKYKIAITHSFKKMLVKRGFPKKNIFVAYNGLDYTTTPHIRPKEQFLADNGVKNWQGKCIIGIASRFHPVKGVDVFLEAAAAYQKAENGGVLFLIAGSGAEESRYRQFVKDKGIEDAVLFLGFVKDIASFYNVLDINVLSSHSESFPYSLLEGAGMRCATISSAVGGIPEMISNGQTGLLFPAGDYQALENCMRNLMHDPALRVQLGTAFYEDAKKRFSAKQMATAHIDFYNRMLKEYKK